MRERLAELVSESCEGALSPAEVMAAAVPLPYLGFTSLAQMRLIDAVEREYGVEIDLAGDISFLDSLDGLAEMVSAGR